MDAEFITGDSCPKWQRWEKENYLRSCRSLPWILPPEALKKYRPLDAIRRRRAKQAAEISSRRRRASFLARRAAKLLKSEFGAKEVILFGSLARHTGFTRWSDIDLASPRHPLRELACSSHWCDGRTAAAQGSTPSSADKFWWKKPKTQSPL